MFPFSYIWKRRLHYIRILRGCVSPSEGCLRVFRDYSTSIIISYCQNVRTPQSEARKAFEQEILSSLGYTFAIYLSNNQVMFTKPIASRLILILAIVMAVASHSCTHHTSKVAGRSAVCILLPDGNSGVKGIVTMHQASQLHPVYYQFAVGGLNSVSYHGVHIHEYGDLTEGCKSAGPHYNPDKKSHGGPRDFNRHVGDLGNLRTDYRGAAEMCILDSATTLYGERSIIGRSVVVHKNKDDLGRGGDLQSTKTGNAGPRLACGVIGLASEFKHFSLDSELRTIQRQ